LVGLEICSQVQTPWTRVQLPKLPRLPKIAGIDHGAKQFLAVSALLEIDSDQ
jgi:hypothetical protein